MARATERARPSATRSVIFRRPRRSAGRDAPVPTARRPRPPCFSNGCAATSPAGGTVLSDHITRAVRADDWRLLRSWTRADLRRSSRAAAALPHGYLHRQVQAPRVGSSSAAASPRISRKTATGTSILSSTGRCRCARRRGCSRSPTGSASPASRAFAYDRSVTRCRRWSARHLGKRLVRAIESRPTVAGAQPDNARDTLLGWHRDHTRSYPWRDQGLPPWQVLMAEMCLHRTRADNVDGVFRALLRIAPTPEDMVDNADEALTAMRSLGLRWRAENVIRVAEELVEWFDGEVPDDDLDLRCSQGSATTLPKRCCASGLGDVRSSSTRTPFEL